MSDLNRLRELAALLKPKQVAEAAPAKAKSFDGIRAVIKDALDDLTDKLSKNGALKTMMDEAGVSKLDTIKDKDGKTILQRLAIRTEQYTDEVQKLLDEAETMVATAEVQESHPEPVLEMANISNFSSGMMRGKKAIELVKAFRAGDQSAELPDGTSFMFKKNIKGTDLEKGQIVFASYNKSNQGANLYEVIGFSDEKDEKNKFHSIKELMKAHGVSTLKALEALESSDKSKEFRLIVRDLEDNSEGAWFYLYEGRWSYGSGAEPLSFSLVEKATD